MKQYDKIYGNVEKGNCEEFVGIYYAGIHG